MTTKDLKSWAREHFRGFENVLMPSFSPDMRTLDEEAIRLDVRQSIRHGFFSTLCALEAGLTLDEKKRMLAAAVDEAGGRIGVSLSLTGESIDEDRQLLAYAEKVGATHALLVYPQGFAPRTQDDVYQFVKALADSTSLGLVLFSSDKFALHYLHPSGLPFDAYERLADLPNVVALKLGGFDAGLTLEAFERFQDRLQVTTVNLGMLPMLAQTIGVQWSGAWTVEALQSPEKPHAVNFLNHLQKGEFAEAMKIYWMLAPALGAMARVLAPLAPTGAYHWPMLKYQQWLSGGNGGLTRQPVMRMFERDMTAIRNGLRAVGVECRDPDEDFFLGRSALKGARA